MNRYTRIFITLFCALPVLLKGADAPAEMTSAYNRGNRAYADGQYAEAIAAYNEALNHGTSANLHYNLANAHAKLEAWGPAVLHYKKALAREPNHADARANLRLSQLQADLDPHPPTFWVRWAENLPLTVWIVAASVAFWLLLGIWWLGGKQLRAPRLKILLTLVCVPTLLAAAPALYGYHLSGKTGVVLGNEVTLRVAPTDQSPGSIIVTAGETARLRRIVKGFYLVELPTGEEGYLAPANFAPIWDSAPQVARSR